MKTFLNQQDKIFFLLALFVAGIVMTNIAGMKIVQIAGIDIAIGAIPLIWAFFVADVLAEVKGQRYTDSLIWNTSIVLLLCYLYIMLALNLPAASRFTQNEEFTAIFSTSARFILASIAAFLLSQLHDVWNFLKIKKATSGRWLWLRSNISSIISLFIDTVVWTFLALYQLTPKFTAEYIWQLIIPYFILKVILSMIDTPFIYLAVNWVKKSKENV